MSESSIEFVPATAEDYDEVMSFSGGIYNGTDYLPFRYHAWLKDHRRRMFLAKSEGKIVAFESFLLVDDGKTAAAEALRVAPWMRGQGVAGLIQKFCLDVLRSEHQSAKRVRLTRTENPPPNMLKKYKVVHSKAFVSAIISSDQLEEAINLLEGRVDNTRESTTYCILEPSEVLKLFDGTKTARELLPGRLLVQGWLPLTTQRSNLEMLFERKIFWIYSKAYRTNVPLSSPTTDPAEFLSLGTPPYPVPYADTTYRFDIDMFGTDPKCAKTHVLQQLKLCMQSLPAGAGLICFMYAEESLRNELSDFCEGLTPFNRGKKQMILEMEI
ncbi:probable N-acetyltransferase 16 [Hyperolius riggenbachi]|uniref:probable N-acetyltransferase 16 n=1 Tax=Hyperolius riggenbachi TaxID=752182 RepID=UPI0035A3B0F0